MTNYLEYLKNAPQELVSSQNRVIQEPIKLSNDVAEKVKSISNDIMVNNTNIVNETIETSPLNDMVDNSQYNNLISFLKEDIQSKKKDWFTTPLEELNIFTGLLKSGSDLISILQPINKTIIIAELDLQKILELLGELFYYTILTFIYTGEELSIYSLITSYTKLSEDPNFIRDKGILFHNSWDNIIIPISIRQPYLLLIKLLEYWFGLDKSYEILDKYIRIAAMKN